ncbi:endonuclease Q family protein [bacterium]|nr:endonuclease Q family protein [bacterium]
MLIADFHIHSRYSRATSGEMNIREISQYAKVKGIDILGTGDFTHPHWLDELEDCLKPVSYGVYEYDSIHFFLTGEISCIYSQSGKVRKIHILVFAPSFEIVHKLDRELSRIGNLNADGRPILGISAKELAKIVLEASDDCFVVPAHIWTPWFSLFGANSGFDDIKECFGELTSQIYALETGLSSDPEMNWALSSLDRFTLISNSDAHSPANLGREANIFNCKIDYKEIVSAIKNKERDKFLGTIEFFPQEGKYHYDGHRNCNVCLSPNETKKYNNVCPRCGKHLTIGVMHRVCELADREIGFKPQGAIPFTSLVLLKQVIGEAIGKTPKSAEVDKLYHYLIEKFGNEFKIMLEVPVDELSKVHPKIAEAIARVKERKVKISPGYDGVYGKVKIFEEEKRVEPEQMSLL